MQRSGNEKVPGCKAKSEHEGHDFCYNPDRSNTDNEDNEDIPKAGNLGRVGNNGKPSSVFPLERCLGDCDSDGKCLFPQAQN